MPSRQGFWFLTYLAFIYIFWMVVAPFLVHTVGDIWTSVAQATSTLPL